MLTNEEMKAQAERCACGGADDYCPCQNVPDSVTKRTSEKTITGAQFIEAAMHAQAMADGDGEY